MCHSTVLAPDYQGLRRVIQVIYSQNSGIRGQRISSPILFVIFFFSEWPALSN